MSISYSFIRPPKIRKLLYWLFSNILEFWYEMVKTFTKFMFLYNIFNIFEINNKLLLLEFIETICYVSNFNYKFHHKIKFTSFCFQSRACAIKLAKLGQNKFSSIIYFLSNQFTLCKSKLINTFPQIFNFILHTTTLM